MSDDREAEALRWARLMDMVGDALLEEGEERHASVQRICADHPDYEEDIKELFQVEQDAEGFLEGPSPGVTHESTPMPELGSQIANYQLLSIVGVGGSSIVYAAEQAEPRRDVALKVLLEGSPSPGALQRFALEADLLANLYHPGIAQVFEAGTSDNGRPWIAMELVKDAKTVTEYASDNDLNESQRIELVVAVCDAISHGHRSGVIHRDIKPANVLVDRDGRPRVIDFGIAKLQGARPTLTATLPGSFLGTLAYMSPEQARGKARDIDTRSDVYSLGVLSYELLCGALPYDLEGMALAEALDYIRNPTPTRPREHGVAGDLEAVLLHALSVDVARRYANADDLAEDLRNTQTGDPVRARPPSFAYFTRCFVRRHRLAVAVTALGLFTVVAGVLGFSLQTARVETRERQRAEQVKDFLLSVLDLAVPRAVADGDWPLSSMLENAGRRIDRELSDNPKAAFQVHATIGKTWRDLGAYERAEEHLLRAVELAGSIYGNKSFEVGVATNALADVLLDAGRFKEAREQLSRSLAIFRTLSDSRLLQAMVARKLSEAYLGDGDLLAAEREATKALDEYTDLFGLEHEATARGQQSLGRVLLASGQFGPAMEQLERALRSDENRHGPDSFATSRMRLQFAEGLRASGEIEHAEKEERAAKKALGALLPAGHPLLGPGAQD